MGRSLQDDLASDAARQLGTYGEFAIEVMYTDGRNTDAVPVRGIWRVTTKPSVDQSRGREVVHTAELQTATSVVIREEGTISVNDETWVVKSVGREMFGQRTIYCHGVNTVTRGPGKVK